MYTIIFTVRKSYPQGCESGGQTIGIFFQRRSLFNIFGNSVTPLINSYIEKLSTMQDKYLIKSHWQTERTPLISFGD